MSRELRDRWTAPLRSGEYEQGRGQLRDRDGRYCCLGVLCEVEGFDLDAPAPGALSAHTGRTWAGSPGIDPAPPPLLVLSMADRIDLATLNDQGAPFTEIADWIEQNVEVE